MVPRGAQTRALMVLALALLLAAPASAAPRKITRYSIAGGCYALRSVPSGQLAAGAERLRMQATTLGSYLLYRPDGTMLAAQEDGSVAPVEQPSPAAEWSVNRAGRGTFTLSPHSNTDSVLAVGAGGGPVLAPAATGARFSFARTSGCAVYPEAELNARGRPARSKTPYGAVGGFLEGHMHWMTFEYFGGEFHCGRPWHRYGIPYALPDCAEVEGPRGSAAPVQNFLNYGNPAQEHDTTGWPKLTEWGAHNLTYEGTYWRWIQRAWLSGLRMMVMSINENRVLCETQQRRRNPCDEMSTVRKGLEDIRELQRYVDAQAGGPGKGFFQIVTTPYQARRVINRGKMAVVLEIEVSEPFGCRGWDNPSCDREQVDRELDEFYRLGVRSSLLLNKFDNPLTGVRFDAGPIGNVINAGNRESAGSYWSAETCTGPLHDNTIEQPSPQGGPFLDSVFGALGVQSGTAPTYPPPPHCNTRGLTDLGRHLTRRMIQKRMIVNPDHMSQKAVDETLTIAESKRYSGVISPHGWMDPGNWPRIWKLGGLAFPDSHTSPGFVDAWRKHRPRRTPHKAAWGYGADLGGLAAQPDGRAGGVNYPFRSYDGKVRFDRQRTGERTFDYPSEGVAHYGLYAEWFEDLRRLGGRKLARDMWNGAEAYLQMWERAHGVRSPRCRYVPKRFSRRGLGRLRLGTRWERLLRRAGQPQQRTRAWSWCVRGRRNRRKADIAELGRRGRVELVASTAHGRSAGGIAVGASAGRVGSRAGARRAGKGLIVRRAGRSAWVYGVRRGRIRAVGVATRALARRPARLRAAMRRVLKARARQLRRRFVPSPAARTSMRTGTSLARSSDPRLDRAFLRLCRIKR